MTPPFLALGRVIETVRKLAPSQQKTVDTSTLYDGPEVQLSVRVPEVVVALVDDHRLLRLFADDELAGRRYATTCSWWWWRLVSAFSGYRMARSAGWCPVSGP